MGKSLVGNYGILLTEIKSRVRSAQYAALKIVNKELVSMCWDIGRMITDRQKGVAWGAAVVARLAGDLQKEFPGVQGFSVSNLWRMRTFYNTYSKIEKLAPLVREIAWSHNIIVLEKCSDVLEREFYIRMTRKYGWSKNVLAINIEAQTYKKYLLNQTNFEKTVPEKVRNQAKLAVKDEYKKVPGTSTYVRVRGSCRGTGTQKQG